MEKSKKIFVFIYFIIALGLCFGATFSLNYYHNELYFLLFSIACITFIFIINIIDRRL